jgi:hypothetical protein
MAKGECMFKKLFLSQMLKINKKLFFIFIGSMLVFTLVTPVGATFYEVRGMIKWGDQPLSKVEAYLVSDSADFVKEYNKNAKTTLEVASGNFYDSYLSLEQKAKEIRMLDERDKNKQAAERVDDFRRLIKLYMLSKVAVNKDGGVYLNISPERAYYLVVLKKNKLFGKDNGFAFWIKKLYFKAGDILQPKEIQLNESNVTFWQ